VSKPDAATAPVLRRARRAPDPGERLRDYTRTRQRILDAALAEFAGKGYAGARVREIAQRAGVNTQLISYYFGGKEGLYNELMATWHRREALMAQEDASFADSIAGYLRAFAARPELLRMFAWEGLTRQSGPRPPDLWPGHGEAPEVTDIRRRQAAGEIAADLDPAFLLIFLMGAAMGMVTLPEHIERLCGVRVGSAEFISRSERQLRLILAHLAGAPPAGTGTRPPGGPAGAEAGGGGTGQEAGPRRGRPRR
jgi:TetR/AcrR family transcriptional regulator